MGLKEFVTKKTWKDSELGQSCPCA